MVDCELTDVVLVTIVLFETDRQTDGWTDRQTLLLVTDSYNSSKLASKSICMVHNNQESLCTAISWPLINV